MISSLSWLFTGILRNGKLSTEKLELKIRSICSPSMLESVFSVMDYHPVLQNFAEYQTLRRDPVPYNQSEKFGLPSLIIAGNTKINTDQNGQSRMGCCVLGTF